MACPHGRRRTRCRHCGGGSICVHGRRTERCLVCGGSNFCVHGRRKERCRHCGGSGFCEHNRHTETCPDCLTVEKILSRKIICHVCCQTRLSKIRLRSGITTCAECDPQVPPRSEHVVVPRLLERIASSVRAGRRPLWRSGCDANRRRPDLLWLGRDRVVSVEIDEHSRRSDECVRWERCTTCRWQSLLGCVPVFYVRVNPDEYDGRYLPLEDRLDAVTESTTCSHRTSPMRPSSCPTSVLLLSPGQHITATGTRWTRLLF